MSDWFIPVIVGVLGVVGGTGFWGYWQSRKEQPVKKRDADLAAAEKSQQMALANAEDLREDLVRLRSDWDAEREARIVLSGRVDQLSEHVREQDYTIRRLREGWRIWGEAWDFLTLNWSSIRLLDSPPQRPYLHPE